MTTIGLLTVSDRCSRGEAVDTAGDQIVANLSSRFSPDWKVVVRKCVPDEMSDISSTLIEWSDSLGLNLVLTVGGTGLSPRDVTPEATTSVLDKPAPGIVHQMISRSLQVTPMAMLSRLTAGVRRKTLIINLPGSKKASVECLEFVASALPHAVDLLCDRLTAVATTHGHVQATPRQHHSCHGHGSSVDAGLVAGRARESPYPMISVADAQKCILGHCALLDTEVVSFEEALGRTLSEDIVAAGHLPPFPASIKDGYAVVSSDGGGTRAVVSSSSDAGDCPDAKLSPGFCMRINTGAPVPAGSDAVVQVEDTRLVRAAENGKDELEIEILTTPQPGQDIRPIGSDIEKGSTVLRRHDVLGPAEVGLLASVGATKVSVFRRPIVSLLSTGNELQDPNDPELKSGAIRDSNKTTLKCLLKEYRVDSVDCGIAKDDPSSLLAKVREGLSKGDFLVTTGGVSMGDRDLLRQVLVQDLAADIHFARVNMKPGKPTTFATLDFMGKKKMVIGLPGNPVSALVTTHLYIIPACLKMSGHAHPMPAVVRAKATKRSPLDPRPEYQRVTLMWPKGAAVAEATPTGNQISSRLLSCSAANGLLVLPPRTSDATHVEEGQELNALVIGRLGV